jgi:hypothetical protein
VDLGDQGPVRPLRHRGGSDHRDLAERGNLGESCGVVAQCRHRHVTDRLEQAALVINQKHHRIGQSRNMQATVGLPGTGLSYKTTLKPAKPAASNLTTRLRIPIWVWVSGVLLLAWIVGKLTHG